jgi:hypothetical protein
MENKVVELYIQGFSFREIAEELELPDAKQLYNWIARRKWLKTNLAAARPMRAVYHEQKALELAEDAKEHNVQSMRLKVDTHKWAAQVNDPGVYGKQVKHVGDPDQPIAFIIDTGIARPVPPTDAIEVPASTPAPVEDAQ